SINKMNHDCGPFSEEWQGKKFYQYSYSAIDFIVYDSTAEISQLVFYENVVLELNGVELNKDLDKTAILKLLGLKETSAPSAENHLLIYPANGDDGYFILEFENSSLFRFTRFDPC
ncbi:MAG: hypothetical protein AAF391_11685, partial [Bacteroidota bacterium]